MTAQPLVDPRRLGNPRRVIHHRRRGPRWWDGVYPACLMLGAAGALALVAVYGEPAFAWLVGLWVGALLLIGPVALLVKGIGRVRYRLLRRALRRVLAGSWTPAEAAALARAWRPAPLAPWLRRWQAERRAGEARYAALPPEVRRFWEASDGVPRDPSAARLDLLFTALDAAGGPDGDAVADAVAATLLAQQADGDWALFCLEGGDLLARLLNDHHPAKPWLLHVVLVHGWLTDERGDGSAAEPLTPWTAAPPTREAGLRQLAATLERIAHRSRPGRDAWRDVLDEAVWLLLSEQSERRS